MRAFALASFAGLLLVAPAAAQAPQYLLDWPAPGAPWAITIGSDGNLWVSMAAAGEVRKYSGNSVWFFTLSGASSGSRQVPSPGLSGVRGLALDASDNLYVASHVGAHVGKISPWPFTELTSWPTGCSANQIALDGAGRVWVTNYYGHDVRVFSTTGTHLFSLGGHGTEPGRFLYPSGIAIGPEGNIYVADQLNHRVQVFGYVIPTRQATFGELKGRYR